MWHALLRLALLRPRALGEHALALADLAAEQGRQAARGWCRQLVYGAAALCAAAATALLGGVALLLWSALPPSAMPRPWLLVLTPAATLVLAMACAWAARRAARPTHFSALRLQLHDDAAMLRGESGAAHPAGARASGGTLAQAVLQHIELSELLALASAALRWWLVTRATREATREATPAMTAAHGHPTSPDPSVR